MNGLVNVLLRHKVFAVTVGITGVALLAIMVAMQMTEDVNWSAFDFAALSVLLLGVGVVLQVVTGAFRTSTRRFAVGAAVVFAAAIVFIELGVGLVGSPIAGT